MFSNNSPQNIKTKDEFELIFKQYFSPLVNFVNQYVKDIELSKEVVQNTFLKLWDKRETLNIDTSLKNYLYRSAKNNMIDYIRKHQKLQIINDEDDKLLKNLPEEDSSPLSPFIIRNEILHAMEQLKPKNKEIFVLSKFEGLTYEEIANHLGISKRSVEDNVARAMARLKDILKDNPEIFK